MWARLSVSSRSAEYEGFVELYFICSTSMDLAGHSFCPVVLSAFLSGEYSQAYFLVSPCAQAVLSLLYMMYPYGKPDCSLSLVTGQG